MGWAADMWFDPVYQCPLPPAVVSAEADCGFGGSVANSSSVPRLHLLLVKSTALCTRNSSARAG